MKKSDVSNGLNKKLKKKFVATSTTTWTNMSAFAILFYEMLA